jgi:hypothetical protein
MATLQSLTINDTGNITLPVGTTANRPTINSTSVSFTTVGTTSWTVPAGVTSLEVLVVAGGGGGGGGDGGGGMGGGGAGGVVYVPDYRVTPGSSLTVTVGTGGSGGTYPSSQPTNGNNSVFDSLIAVGGGAGDGTFGNSQNPGDDGGSGGGGSGYSGTNQRLNGGLGGNPVVGQGHRGGLGGNTYDGGGYKGGGGGGAGQRGQDWYEQADFSTASNLSYGLNGGDGVMYDITGTPTYYAGGGGGGTIWSGWAYAMPGGRGGAGGGGPGGSVGATSSSQTVGTAGTANTGGGGGAGAYQASGANGGSGIVVVRYSLTSSTTHATAQTRYNTGLQTLEYYNSNNKWETAVTGDPIVYDGLFMHYDASKFNTAGTTWLDLTGNGNHLTLNNGPVYTSNWGGGITFDGSNDTATTSSMTTNTAAGYTAEMWVRLNEKDRAQGFFSIGPAASVGPYVNFYMASNNLMRWEVIGNTGSAYSTITSTTIFTVGKWYHVAATFDRRYTRIYINGIEESNQVMTNQPTTVTGTTTIASYAGFASATISVIRGYTRALSTVEITKNYNAQRSRFYAAELIEQEQVSVAPPDKLWYDFNHQACILPGASSCYDLTGNGYNGSLNNSPTLSYWPQGAIGFNGTNQSITIGGNAGSELHWTSTGWVTNSLTTMTIEMWVYAIDDGFFFSKPWNGSGQYNIYVAPWYFNLYDGVTSTGITFSDPQWRKWTHLVCWADSHRMGAYMNGVPQQTVWHGQSSQSAPPSGVANVQPVIGSIYPGGAYGAGGLQLTGRVSTCKIWSRVLGPAEVKKLFNSTRTQFGI